MKRLKKHDLKPVSFKRLYNTIHFNILPYIGDLSVSDLTVQLINDKLINPLIDKGYSYSSIKKVKSALHSFYEYYLVKKGIVYAYALLMPVKLRIVYIMIYYYF